MRGIEAVVALVLLLIMTVGLVAVVWMIFGPTMRQTSQTTGGQVKSTAAQHALETILQNLRSTCENNVGGHFLPKGFTGQIDLDIGGARVTLVAGNYNFNNSVLCVYRAGTEADSPVVIAQVDLGNATLFQNLSKGETVNLQWAVQKMCPVENDQVVLVYLDCTYNATSNQLQCSNFNSATYDNESKTITIDNKYKIDNVNLNSDTSISGWYCAKAQ
jgi:hypothetical protein